MTQAKSVRKGKKRSFREKSDPAWAKEERKKLFEEWKKTNASFFL
jgi:hypothetical protein